MASLEMAMHMAMFEDGVGWMTRDKGSGSVYQNAKGQWVASLEAGWTRSGARRRRTRIAATKREALVKLQAMRREDAPEEGVREATTVKSYSVGWLERQELRLRPESLGVSKAAIKVAIESIGHKRLSHLTPADIRAFDKAALDGREVATAARYRGPLVKLLRDARLDGHAVPERVFDVETLPPGEGREEIPLEHATMILAAAAARPDQSRWAAAMLNGLRPAEALGLTWDRVDLDARTLDVTWQLKSLRYKVKGDRTSGFRVPLSYEVRRLVDTYHLVRPKTSAGKRIIPMVPWLAESLRAWRQATPLSPYGLVWPRYNGRPQTAAEDRQAWKEIVEKAKTGAYDLYSCRHTTATVLRQARVSDEVITAIVGHSTILSTRAYIHVRQEPLREALDAVADRLGLTLPIEPDAAALDAPAAPVSPAAT